MDPDQFVAHAMARAGARTLQLWQECDGFLVAPVSFYWIREHGAANVGYCLRSAREEMAPEPIAQQMERFR
jgi:hypothetical protein